MLVYVCCAAQCPLPLLALSALVDPGIHDSQVLAAIVATSPSLERIDIADNPGKFSAAGCNLALLCAARATEESTAGVVKLAGCGVGDGAAEAVAAALLSPDGAKFKKIGATADVYCCLLLMLLLVLPC